MRSFIFIVICVLLFSLWPAAVHADPGVSAANAVLMEQQSGRVLFEQQAHEQQPIASITKIMTALLVVESGMMNENATVSKRAVHTEGSSIYLEQGEEMTVKDLVYGLMLRSGNDAAVVLSEHTGGSVEGFVHLMNQKAAWLGMTDTNFENPHGLHMDNHYSTAYDMARLMRYAMNNEVFRKISKTRSYKSESRAYPWKNKNKLLTSHYQYCTGGKTGYTTIAGRTLVTTASKDDMDLIAVTLNAPDDWNDHIQMFDWAFEKYSMSQLSDVGSDQARTNETSESNLAYPLTREERTELIRQNVHLNKGNGTPALTGKTFYYLKGEVIAKSTTSNDVDTRPSFHSLVRTVFKDIIRLNTDG